MSRRGQTPHSWHSCVKTRIFEIFKFVYFHHFEWVLNAKDDLISLFDVQGGPRHDQQLLGHEDEVGDAQIALRYRDSGGVIGDGQLESEVRSLLQGENMMNLTFIFAIKTLLNPWKVKLNNKIWLFSTFTKCIQTWNLARQWIIIRPKNVCISFHLYSVCHEIKCS